MIIFRRRSIFLLGFLFTACAGNSTRPTVYLNSESKYDNLTKEFRNVSRYCVEGEDRCYIESCSPSTPPECVPVTGESEIKKQYFEMKENRAKDTLTETGDLEKICQSEGPDRCVEEFQTRSPKVKELSHALICSQKGVTCRKREVPATMPIAQWDILEENQVLLDRSVTHGAKGKDVAILNEVIATVIPSR